MTGTISARAILAIFAGFSAALFLGCGSDACGPGDPCGPETFEVRVLTTDDEPVEGAYIHGGIDRTRYRVRTDSCGVALVPGSGQGQYAEIHKDNFKPVAVSALEPGKYYIYRTLARLERIGAVAGKSIRFNPDLLITLEWQGTYHAYAYDESTVTEIAGIETEAHAIMDAKSVNDTLWLCTASDGVYAYSLEYPTSPTLLLHLDIEDLLDHIAVTDSIIAVSYFGGEKDIDVFSYTPSGEVRLISSFTARYVRQMEFRGHYLILLSYHNDGFGYHGYLKVVDLADPHAPHYVYSVHETGGRSGLIANDYVLIGPNWTEQTDWISYTTLSIDDPENPAYAGRTLSDTWVYSICDFFAVGEYCRLRPLGNIYTTPLAVVQGAPGLGFDAVAILSESRIYDRPGVQKPPFFVIGDVLWRLEWN